MLLSSSSSISSDNDGIMDSESMMTTKAKLAATAAAATTKMRVSEEEEEEVQDTLTKKKEKLSAEIGRGGGSQLSSKTFSQDTMETTTSSLSLSLPSLQKEEEQEESKLRKENKALLFYLGKMAAEFKQVMNGAVKMAEKMSSEIERLRQAEMDLTRENDLLKQVLLTRSSMISSNPVNKGFLK